MAKNLAYEEPRNLSDEACQHGNPCFQPAREAVAKHDRDNQ